jgi:hypothetical protein
MKLRPYKIQATPKMRLNRILCAIYLDLKKAKYIWVRRILHACKSRPVLTGLMPNCQLTIRSITSRRAWAISQGRPPMSLPLGHQQVRHNGTRIKDGNE